MRMALGMVVACAMLSATTVFAQQPAAQQPAAQQPPAPAGQAQAVSNARKFPGDAGMVLNFIKPDKTADFEAVIAKLKEALASKPEWKAQAESWKVFKSPDPAGQNVLYVFIIDPVVKEADYQISNIIAAALPNEANEILKKYAECYAQGMNIVNLNIISALGK